MAKILPLFPLKLVAFPGERLNLHVFEPRYKQLIQECEEQGTTFGIPPYFDEHLYEFGTEIKLLEIAKRYDDGKLDIRTEAIGIFKIKEFHRKTPGKLYASAEITALTFTREIDVEVNRLILENISELHEILMINKKLPDSPESFISFDLGHLVGFTVDQELEFLTIREEKMRQNMMLEHLQKLIPIARRMKQMRIRAKLNGHFQNLKPPNF